MSNPNIEEALAALKPNIVAHLDVYRVGRKDESTVLPQALWTSPEELRALRQVIDFAATIYPACKQLEEVTTGCNVVVAKPQKRTDANMKQWAQRSQSLSKAVADICGWFFGERL
jgi:hypothetical protein